MNRLTGEIESQKQRTNEQSVRIEQQGKIIEDLVKYAMSASIFHHLAGITLLKDYRYHDGESNRREFYFLRDAGYVKPKQGAFIDFGPGLDGANIVDHAEPTPIGYLCVQLRKRDIPEEMTRDPGNLRLDPSAI